MATRSAGSDSKDSSSSASTTARANTSTASSSSNSSSAAAVKAASPTTSVRSVGSDTQDLRGADTSSGSHGGNSQAFSGSTSGIAAAVGMRGADTGTGHGNQTADPVDRSSSMNWNQFDDMVNGSPTRTMAQIAAAGGFDLVDRTPSHNWMQLQDMLDAAQQQRYPGIQLPDTIDPAGSRQDFASYLHDVQNGSMGMPGAVGYGTDGSPAAATPGNSLLLGKGADSDPFSGLHNLQAAIGGLPGFDLAGLAHALNGPYLQRQAQNGGVAPFEGPVDTAGMIRQLNAPYYRSTATPGPMDVPGERTTYQQLDDMLNDPTVFDTTSMAPNDRLPSERRVQTTDVIPAYATDSNTITRDLNPDGTHSAPLEAIQAATAAPGNDVFATDGQVTTADGALVRPGVPASGKAPASITVHGGKDTSTAPAGDKPSTWDTVVDNTGKLLSHTGLGSIVSGMFPDLWNGMGDAFKGVDNGPGVTPKYPDEMAAAVAGMQGDPHSGQPQGFTDFIDLNHNGIDDRYESAAPATAGIAAAAVPTTDATGYSGNQFRSNRYATFPDMPPYQPGKDDEWNYFHDHLARGGVVGYSDRDPRVGMIADAEDALHRGDHQHASITQFVDAFGPKALEHLNTNVLAGHRMRAGLPGRTVVGPGGPIDDAVPAVIDGQHPAKLSSGEFVVPVAAVEGIGDGDPRVGADRLHALVSRFAAK